jgi:hypothetical protein
MNKLINSTMITNNTEAQDAFINFDSFYDKIININSYITLEMELISNECNGMPHASISVNDTELFSEELSGGSHKLSFKYDILDQTQFNLSISMSGKNTNDTMVDADGNITHDKCIILADLKINNFDILRDYNLFYKTVKYKNNTNGQFEDAKAGFWNNSTLVLDATIPFVNWYNENSTKNINLSNSMQYRKMATVHIEFDRLVNNLNLLDI